MSELYGDMPVYFTTACPEKAHCVLRFESLVRDIARLRAESVNSSSCIVVEVIHGDNILKSSDSDSFCDGILMVGLLCKGQMEDVLFCRYQLSVLGVSASGVRPA